jgi:hypothetical protein
MTRVAVPTASSRVDEESFIEDREGFRCVSSEMRRALRAAAAA